MEFIRQIEKYFWAVYLFLIAVLCYQLADTATSVIRMELFSSISQEESSLQNDKSDQLQPSASAITPASKFDDIVKANIFNTSKKTPEIKKDKEAIIVNIDNLDSIPLSRSGLQLLGTSTGENNEKIALIKNKQEVDVFRVNEQTPGGKVNQILRRNVILINNGKPEKLVLDTAPPEIKSFSREKTAVPGIMKTSETSLERRIQRSQLGLGNMSDFMTQMRLSPFLLNGKTNGFLVSQIKPGSVLSKLGIMNGDVIKEINSTKILSPEKAYEVYKQLMNKDSVSVSISRANKNMTLNYQLTD